MREKKDARTVRKKPGKTKKKEGDEEEREKKQTKREAAEGAAAAAVAAAAAAAVAAAARTSSLSDCVTFAFDLVYLLIMSFLSLPPFSPPLPPSLSLSPFSLSLLLPPPKVSLYTHK